MKKNIDQEDFNFKFDKEEIINHVNSLSSEKINKEELKQLNKELFISKEIKKLKEEISLNENYINLINKDKQESELFLTDTKDIKENKIKERSEFPYNSLSELENPKSKIEFKIMKFSNDEITNLKFKSAFMIPSVSKPYCINNNSVLSLYRKNILKDKNRVLTELDDLNKLSINFKKMNNNFRIRKKNQSISENCDKLSEKKVYETEINLKSYDNEKREITLPKINNMEKLPLSKKNSKIDTKISSQKIFIEKKDCGILISEELKSIKSNEIQKERIKTFKIKFINNWFIKNGFTEPNLKIGLDHDFQIGFITDQIKVLLDSIQYFRFSILNTNDSSILFNNFAFNKQAEFNKLLEETCGLVIEICTIILADFYEHMPKFVAIQIPNPNLLKDKKTFNEFNNYLQNCEILSNCFTFLKSCLEVYEILTKQVNDMYLLKNKFCIIQQYLSRARFNVSNLIFIMKNAKKGYDYDQKMTKKYSFKAFSIETHKLHLKTSKPPIPKLNKNFIDFQDKKDIGEKLRHQTIFKPNEEKERQRRLNAVLKQDKKMENDSFEFKRKDSKIDYKKEFNMNCKLINNLIKYCPKDIKNKITSLKIIEKYKDDDSDD